MVPPARKEQAKMLRPVSPSEFSTLVQASCIVAVRLELPMEHQMVEVRMAHNSVVSAPLQDQMYHTWEMMQSTEQLEACPKWPCPMDYPCMAFLWSLNMSATKSFQARQERGVLDA